jgi:hypothetical protein
MTVIQNQIGAKASYGTIWMNNANWTGANYSVTTSYTELTGLSTSFTLVSPSNDFTMTTDGRLKYTGTNNRSFNVVGYVGYGASGRMALGIFKNGSFIADSYSFTGATAMETLVTVTLSTNDYLSLFVKRFTATTVPFYQISLSAINAFSTP